MAGVKKLTSYFKLLTKDEMEVNQLLATQLSKTASIESAKTLSTLSSAVMSAIDLTDLSSATAADYMSDDNPENIVSNYLDEGDCE